MKIQVINMSGQTSDCGICGIEHFPEYVLPMYEGRIVGWDDEWAGIPVCKQCYESHKHLVPGRMKS